MKRIFIITAIALTFVMTIPAALSKSSNNKNNNIAKKENSTMAMIKSDIQLFNIYRQGLIDSINYLDNNQDIFPKEKIENKELLNSSQRKEVRTVWNRYLDYHLALGSLKQKYQKYDEIDGSEEIQDYAFGLYHAIFNAQYNQALKFIARVENNKQLDKVMNEEVPELGLPANTYKEFKYEYLNVVVATKFAALQTIRKLSGKEKVKELNSAVKEDASGIWEMGKGKGELLTIKNAGKIAKSSGEKILYPFQVNVSEWMGDTKVYRKGVSLIKEEDINEMKKALEPGDIMFTRREWYVSNIGLPGYWPHAAFIIGSEKEREEYFNDEAVESWVRTVGKDLGVEVKNLNQLLEKAYPEAYTNSNKKHEGKEVRVLEAIGEGVLFHSLEYSAAADSVAVIRPKLSKLDKAKAIYKAFSHAGKPYDFNFDFQTDLAIVCTELVYKSYEDKIEFEVPRMLGRYVLSPNDMVKQFSEAKDKGNLPLSFVYFLDGDEYGKKSIVRTEKEFLDSWQRPKWHIIFN